MLTVFKIDSNNIQQENLLKILSFFPLQINQYPNFPLYYRINKFSPSFYQKKSSVCPPPLTRPSRLTPKWHWADPGSRSLSHFYRRPFPSCPWRFFLGSSEWSFWRAFSASLVPAAYRQEEVWGRCPLLVLFCHSSWDGCAVQMAVSSFYSQPIIFGKN